MNVKSVFRLIVVVAILVGSFASTGGAMAWSGCASYITVQWGDTLSGLARLCGTTMEAIRAANPGLVGGFTLDRCYTSHQGMHPLLPLRLDITQLMAALTQCGGEIPLGKLPREVEPL